MVYSLIIKRLPKKQRGVVKLKINNWMKCNILYHAPALAV